MTKLLFLLSLTAALVTSLLVMSGKIQLPLSTEMKDLFHFYGIILIPILPVAMIVIALIDRILTRKKDISATLGHQQSTLSQRTKKTI